MTPMNARQASALGEPADVLALITHERGGSDE